MAEKNNVIQSPKRPTKPLRILPCPQPNWENISSTELKNRYKAEYDSWRNRKSRSGAHWQPEFKRFRDFLRIMGPMPGQGYTLDRINNSDPRYGEGLCRWATKRQQAANRSSSIRLIGAEGEHVARSEISDCSLSELRRDLCEQPEFFGKDPRKYMPWPKIGGRAREWEKDYLDGWNQSRTRFEHLIRTLKPLIEKAEEHLRENCHPDDDDHSEDTIYYLSRLEEWRKWLREAELLRPAWEQAVRVYQGMEYERRMLRRLDFLDRGSSAHDDD